MRGISSSAAPCAGFNSPRTTSISVAERSAAALSESSSTSARADKTPTCSSPEAAMGMHRYTVSPSQSTPLGNWRKPRAVRRTRARAWSVPCGMATPSPMYVEIWPSRSRIAAAYPGATAPSSSRRAPDWRNASHLSWACCAGRVAHEDLERHHDRAGRDALGPLREPGVTDHHLRVGRNGVHGEVLDRHVVLLQAISHLAGDHHAAAHPGIAGDDHRPDIPSVQLGHVGHAPLGLVPIGSCVAAPVVAASATGCSARPKPSSAEATPNETTLATATASSTPKAPSLGVTDR